VIGKEAWRRVPGVITTFQALGLMLTVPLMLILIPRFGVEGAAAALLMSTVMRLLFVTISFRSLLKVKCPRIVASGEDISRLAEAIGIRLGRAPA
jgi:O-antigen/teichoic acid export membrane protein